MMRGTRTVRALAVATLVAATVAVGATSGTAGAGAPPILRDVTTTDDVVDAEDGVLSIREAFLAADASPGPDNIRLQEGALYELTDCEGNLGLLDEGSAGALIITGRGATIRSACSGGQVVRTELGDVTIRDLTITSDDLPAPSAPGLLVYADTGAVLLERVSIANNTSTNGSGGGGLWAQGDGGITVRDSVLIGNTATNGGGGGARFDSPTTVVRTAAVGNSSLSYGAGLLFESDGTVYSSTIAANDKGNIGGGAGVASFGSLVLRHATVADNTGPFSHVYAADLTLAGTIISAPEVATELCFANTITSNGQNYSTSDCGLGGADTKDGPDPMLRSPFDNGGNTATVYPSEGSPVLDVVPGDDPQLFSLDQRNLPRPAGPAGDVGALEVQPCGDRFTDVAAGQAFCWEIGWLAAAGVTGGQVDGSYGITAPVTRASMAAFLYRLAGSPPVEAPEEASFPDVPIDHPFFVPVEWLATTGVTSGFGDGTFRPGVAVTRGSMAAFLYRLAGAPPFAPGDPSFPDVPPGSTFFVPVEWLASTGITGGFGDGLFRPGAPVSRQSMAAFLYRFADGQPILPS